MSGYQRAEGCGGRLVDSERAITQEHRQERGQEERRLLSSCWLYFKKKGRKRNNLSLIRFERAVNITPDLESDLCFGRIYLFLSVLPDVAPPLNERFHSLTLFVSEEKSVAR